LVGTKLTKQQNGAAASDDIHIHPLEGHREFPRGWRQASRKTSVRGSDVFWNRTIDIRTLPWGVLPYKKNRGACHTF